jgi:hypothetical protein
VREPARLCRHRIAANRWSGRTTGGQAAPPVLFASRSRFSVQTPDTRAAKFCLRVGVGRYWSLLVGVMRSNCARRRRSR